jgi:hypothetical protein
MAAPVPEITDSPSYNMKKPERWKETNRFKGLNQLHKETINVPLF